MFRRRKDTPTVTTTDPTPAPANPALPAGHDAPDSRWYVPEPLRRHYRPPATYRAEWYQAGARQEATRQLVAALAANPPAWNARLNGAPPFMRQLMIATGPRPSDVEPGDVNRLAADLLADEDAFTWWAHARAIYDAQQDAAQDAKHDQEQAWWAADHTCAVCGTVGVAVTPWRVPGWETTADGMAVRPTARLCGPCRPVLAAAVAARHADDPLPTGGTRGGAAAALAARHADDSPARGAG
jgi:hypothetical protein